MPAFTSKRGLQNITKLAPADRRFYWARAKQVRGETTPPPCEGREEDGWEYVSGKELHEICPDLGLLGGKTHKRFTPVGARIRADGAIVARGDLVLMQTSQENYMRRMRENSELANGPVKDLAEGQLGGAAIPRDKLHQANLKMKEEVIPPNTA